MKLNGLHKTKGKKMNKTVKYNGQYVPTNAYLRSELRKAGVPTFREIRGKSYKVGYVHSNRRKSSVKHVSGIEAVQYSENPSVLIRWTDGWKSEGHDFTTEQIDAFVAQAIEIALSLGFEVRNSKVGA